MSPDAPRDPEIDPQDGSAASERPRPSPAEAAGETPAAAQGGLPSPLPAAAPGLPKHLEPLADLFHVAALVLCVAGVLLSFISPWLGLACYVAVAATWLVPDRRFENQLE